MIDAPGSQCGFSSEPLLCLMAKFTSGLVVCEQLTRFHFNLRKFRCFDCIPRFFQRQVGECYLSKSCISSECVSVIICVFSGMFVGCRFE